VGFVPQSIKLLRYCQVSKEAIINEPAGVVRGPANRGDIDAALSLTLAGLLAACSVAVPQGE
jgi:hypothetical protein